MTRLLANRTSVALAAALFAAGTWLSASVNDRPAPTSLVLSQPAQSLEQVASLEQAPSL